MDVLLLILILLLISGGFSLMYSADSYQKDETPGMRYFSPKLWFVPIWKAGKFRQWFKFEGYCRFIIGWVMIAVGGALSVIFFALKTGRL